MKSFNRLNFKIGAIIILVEVIVLAALGVYNVTRFQAQIDSQVRLRAEIPGSLMDQGVLDISAIAEKETMERLVGRDLVTLVDGMIIFTNGTVFHSLNPDYVGLEIAEVPGLNPDWFTKTTTASIVEETVEDGDSFLINVTPILAAEGEAPFLFAYTKVNTNQAQEEKATILWLFVIGSAVAIGLTSLILFFSVQGIVLKRINTLLTTLERVEAGDLAARVEQIGSHDEIGVLQEGVNSMANQIQELVTGLENRVADRTRRLEIVATLGEQLNAILDLNSLLDEVVNQIKQNFGYYHAHIYLLDEKQENLVVAAGTGKAGREMKENGHSIALHAPISLVAKAARTGDVITVSDVQTEAEWLLNPLLPNTQSEMAVPIIRQGEVVGILDVHEDTIDALDESDANLLRSLANQVGVALTNARLFAETVQTKEHAELAREEAEAAKEKAERAYKETEAANKALEVQIWHTSGQTALSDSMRGEQDIATLANQVVSQLCQYLSAQVGALYVLTDDTLTLTGTYAYNGTRQKQQFKMGEGLVGQVAYTRQPLILTDIPEDYLHIESALGETVPRHIMLFPYLYEDQVIGVIEMGTLTEFSPAQKEFVQAALTNIAIAFNTARTRARIDELLAQTQRQAEELQAQGEELRVANEELEAQTRSLRTSEAKLKENQVELEAINTQLEEKATKLEESSATLRAQQETLDRQNRELKQAQKSLEQKAAELAQTSKYKSEFLANMSHELRTPLNSLLLLSGMLQRNEDNNLTEDQLESIQIIHRGGQDLLELINEILDLSKIEAGQMTFHMEPVSLADLSQTWHMQFDHVAADKGLEFHVTLAPDMPGEIYTDRQRLQQIIKNFLSNAFKFTSSGSVTIKLAVPEQLPDGFSTTLAASEMVSISVQDSGIGMTPEQQKIIFEAFQQADGSTSRQYGGTGLGLSISRELAHRLGGTISVASNQGEGSTFTLYLPQQTAVSGEREVPRKSSSTGLAQKEPVPVVNHAVQVTKADTAAANGKANGHVSQTGLLPDDRDSITPDDHLILLVIEDDINFAPTVRDLARQKGFKCLLAVSGEEGLQLVQAYNPAAIVLDLHLPGISGWQVLETLKANPTTRHIPVHIISADEEMMAAYQKGSIGFLTKPVSPSDLDTAFARLERFIAGKNRTLLLVEDDADTRHSVKKLLAADDVTILEAESGAAALNQLRSEQVDCMILDLSLPDMSGLELLQQIEADAVLASCPVIIYTGRELNEDESREIAQHANRIIVKGVRSMERLLDETSLFLHQIVAEMPDSKQQTIRQLYTEDRVFQGKRVLLVDDDMRNSFALSKLLSQKGLQVRIAANGQQALDILAEDPMFDLVLMDIMMPVLDGYEAMQQIRRQTHFSTLPVLALTAKAMKGDREKCLAAGANDYLPKPIDPERLFNMLRVWLY